MQTIDAHTTNRLLKPPSSSAAHDCEIVDLLANWDTLQPRWDEFVEKHPKGSVFHTSAMIRVYEATKDNRPLALASVRVDGKVMALLVSVRVQTLPPPLGRLSSRAVFYAEPLCYDHPDSMKALSQLVARHDAKLRRSVLFAEVRPLHAGGPERIVLERAGYAYLEYLNYLNDVTKPIDEMWSAVHKSTISAIKQCNRRGLTVQEVPVESAVSTLYPILKASYERSGVPFADRSLFEATVRELHPLGRTHFFAVYEDSRPVAMDVMLSYKDRIYLWYGGVERTAAGSPGSLLRWYELKWAHEQGFAICDSGGAGWPNVPYGVRDFKRKFGGELVQYGRYRKVFAPWKLALAERVYNLKRSLSSQK